MTITTGNEGGDAVNHPPHYNQHPSGIECIDIIRHFNLDVGSAIKYLWRAGLKTDLTEDELTAELRDTEIWFLKDHAEELRRRQVPPIVSMRVGVRPEDDGKHPFRPGGDVGLYCAVCSFTRNDELHDLEGSTK
jgi:hypothetical protein